MSSDTQEIKDVAFATVDDRGMPQVRIIDVMLVEDEKLYFCTARGKEFYHQLMVSGYTAITGIKSGIPDGAAKQERQKAGGSEEMDRPHF